MMEALMVIPMLIKEHMEVLGSDGAHVGTVDHLEGADEIKLTKDHRKGLAPSTPCRSPGASHTSPVIPRLPTSERTSLFVVKGQQQKSQSTRCWRRCRRLSAVQVVG